MSVVIIGNNSLITDIIRDYIYSLGVNIERVYSFRNIDAFLNAPHMSISILIIDYNASNSIANVLEEAGTVHLFSFLPSILIFDSLKNNDDLQFYFDRKRIYSLAPPYQLETMSLTLKTIVDTDNAIKKVINLYNTHGLVMAIGLCEDIAFHNIKSTLLIDALEHLRGMLLTQGNKPEDAHQYYLMCMSENNSIWALSGTIRTQTYDNTISIEKSNSSLNGKVDIREHIYSLLPSLNLDCDINYNGDMCMRTAAIYRGIFNGDYAAVSNCLEQYKKQLKNTTQSRYFCKKLIYSIMSNIVSQQPSVNSILVFYMEASKEKLSLDEKQLILGFIKKLSGNLFITEKICLEVLNKADIINFETKLLLAFLLINIGKFDDSKKLINTLDTHENLQSMDLHEYIPMRSTIKKIDDFRLNRIRTVKQLTHQRDNLIKTKEYLDAVSLSLEIYILLPTKRNAYLLLFLLTKAWPKKISTLSVESLVQKLQTVILEHEKNASTYSINCKSLIFTIISKIQERKQKDIQ